MTIRLSKDLEQFVHEAVRAGLYAREDDVIREALMRLREAMPGSAPPKRKSRRVKAMARQEQPVSRDELDRRLLASGLVTRLPDSNQDFDDDDDDTPIVIQGEPLSETIIRERR